MHHFGVELDSVILPLLVGNGREGRVFRGGDDLKAIGNFRHAVAMAHPDLMPRTRLPDAIEQGGGLFSPRPRRGRTHGGARPRPCRQLLGHCLLAIADAKTGRPDSKIREGTRGENSSVTEAGPPDRMTPWAHRREGLFRRLKRVDFAIDTGLAHAAGNELGDLRTEIDNEDRIMPAWEHSPSKNAFGWLHRRGQDLMRCKGPQRVFFNNAT